ncbi:unnamed protein product [Cylindrotheca closterium]|uniref:Uncharacterized protein n=1 Tax=Cylindrotheca closterium TaxID=2856 RepID=A0AAD2FZK5_9STRA|nr:unnamed protein product [Cylindrotheca closterium]
MSQVPSNNKEALAHYRKVRDFNKRYSAVDESTHSEHYDDGASWISSSTRSITTSGSSDLLAQMMMTETSPRLSPIRSRTKRSSKYHGEHNMKTLQEKSPGCVDRSLRNQDWLGSTPVSGEDGTPSSRRRTWKLKNPEDLDFLTMKN